MRHTTMLVYGVKSDEPPITDWEKEICKHEHDLEFSCFENNWRSSRLFFRELPSGGFILGLVAVCDVIDLNRHNAFNVMHESDVGWAEDSWRIFKERFGQEGDLDPMNVEEGLFFVVNTEDD